MKEFIERAKSLNMEVEILKTNQKQISFELDSNKIRQYEILDDVLYKVKCCIDGKYFSLNTEKLDDELFDKLKLTAKYLENDDKDEFAVESINEDVIYPIKLDKDLMEQFKKIVKNLKKQYSFKEVSITFKSEFKSETIENTLGTKLYQNNNFIDIYISLVYENNSEIETKFISRTYCNLNLNLILDLLNKEIKYENFGMEQLKIKTDKYNVVLKNGVIASILNKIMASFSAEHMDKKISTFTNDFNKKIFSSKFSLVEDPQSNLLPKKRLFDSEGSKTIYKDIIKNGVFKSKLYNKKEAMKDGVTSSGNANGFSNVYVKKGDVSFEELVSEMNSGIIIDDVFGTHSGINLITGDMSLQANGKLVSNGKIIGSLKNIILNTNIKELFCNLKEVGNDFETRGNMSTVSMLFNNVSITGNDE